MTICTECRTHIGPTRRTCGGCGVHIKRDTPDGRVIEARNKQGQLVYQTRPNSALEREALFGRAGRAEIHTKSAARYATNPLTLAPDYDITGLGNFAFGKGRAA